MLECVVCQKCYHNRCLEFTDAEAEVIGKFVCFDCFNDNGEQLRFAHKKIAGDIPRKTLEEGVRRKLETVSELKTTPCLNVNCSRRVNKGDPPYCSRACCEVVMAANLNALVLGGSFAEDAELAKQAALDEQDSKLEALVLREAALKNTLRSLVKGRQVLDELLQKIAAEKPEVRSHQPPEDDESNDLLKSESERCLGYSVAGNGDIEPCRKTTSVCEIAAHKKANLVDPNTEACGWPVYFDSYAVDLCNLSALPTVDVLFSKGMCLKAREDCSDHFDWLEGFVQVLQHDWLRAVNRLDEIADSRKRLTEANQKRRPQVDLVGILERSFHHQLQRGQQSTRNNNATNAQNLNFDEALEAIELDG